MATTHPPQPDLDQIKNPVIRDIAAVKIAAAERHLSDAQEMQRIDYDHAEAMWKQFCDLGYHKFFLTRWIGQYLYDREMRLIPFRFQQRKRRYERCIAAIIRTAVQLDTIPLLHLPTENNGPEDYETILALAVHDADH